MRDFKPEDLLVVTPWPPTGAGMTTGDGRGVLVEHLPTGLAVAHTAERSQHKNKARAIERLAVLLDLAEQRR